MRKTKIIFWVTTGLIFIMEGIIPAFTSQTELAKEGIRHLQYPEYFGNSLVVFKVLGALSLIIPQVPKRIKEWAYAGFAFDFIFASISHFSIDGMSDHISFNVANAGYNVAKYVPYGPVKAVLPYLFRRANENTSISGQMGRELSLIVKEMKRRKAK
jgi:hypothetical protein